MFKSTTVLFCLLGVYLVSQVQGYIVKGIKDSHHGASWKTNHFRPVKMFKRSTGDPREGFLKLPYGETRPIGEGVLRQIPSNIAYDTRQFPTSEGMRPRQLPQGRTIGPIVDKISQGIADGLSVGISTGISSGVTNSVYALPDAISGTIQNLKHQEQLGGGGGLYGGGGQYGGGSYLSPIKGGLTNSLSSGLGHGTPYYGGLGHGTSYSSFSKPYPSYTMSPVFSSGFSGIHSGSSGLYSTQGLQGNVYSGGISPYFNKHPIITSLKPSFLPSKPIGGYQHVAPAAPYHWDCQLVPASYGNKLGYKDAGDDMENEASNLRQLIQDAEMNDGQMRSLAAPKSSEFHGDAMSFLGVPHSSEFSGEPRMIKDGQPIRIVGLPASTQFQGVDGQQMMSGAYRDNLLREIEERKNLALLEEMNMSLPPLGMIDPNKLVDSGDIAEFPIHSNQQQGGETPFMMMLIPMTDGMGKQETAADQHQAAVGTGQQLSGVHNQAALGQQIPLPLMNQGIQENEQEAQHGVLRTKAGGVVNQDKHQQQQHPSNLQPNLKQQPHGQTQQPQSQTQQPHGQTQQPHGQTQQLHGQTQQPHGQNNEPIGAHSTHIETKTKPEPTTDVKKSTATSASKGKTIVHDELRQSDQENLIEQSENDLESQL